MTFEELVRKKGFTQAALGKALGTTHTTIYRWCKGINEPDCTKIIKLSKVLNVSIESLVYLFAKGGE